MALALVGRARPYRRPRGHAPWSPTWSLGGRTPGQRGRHACHVARSERGLGSVDIEGLIATTSEEFVTDAPLEVTMPGVYLVWSISAATVVLVLAISDWLVARRSGHAD